MEACKKKKKPLIILTGPTAVGKTALSIGLAKAVGGEIISADSMQVYKGMDVGTAKITSEEMDGVTHYLVDELEPMGQDESLLFVETQEIEKNYPIPSAFAAYSAYLKIQTGIQKMKGTTL